MRFVRRFPGALLVGGLVAALAACGSPSAPATPSVSASGDTEPSAALVSAAQKEGQVVFYSALNTDQQQKLADAFKAKYGITMVGKQSASGASIQAASAQLDAGNVQVDLISITPDPKFQQKYDSSFAAMTPADLPILQNLPAEAANPKFVQAQFQYYGYIYNTDELKGSALPASLDALVTDPALKGKIGTADIAASNSYVNYHAILYDAWGADKWNTWIKNMLTNQKAKVGTSSAALTNDVASGAISIFGPVAFQQATALVAQGAPLAIKYYDPVMKLPNGLISFTKSPHPNATKVFVNWLLTAQAQEILCGGNQCGSYLNLPDTAQKPTGVSIVDAPVARGAELGSTLTAAFKSAAA
jgi:iron(III) transport system substrate-binding protein